MATDKNKSRFSLFRKAFKWLVGIAALIGFALWAGGKFKEKTPPGKVAAEIGMPIPEHAETVVVKKQSIAPRIDVVGTTASEELIHLSARISAYVKKVSVSAGARVKEGQVLVTLDDRELQQQVAAVAAALNLADTEYKRTQRLFKQDAATDQDLTAALSAYQLAQADDERVKVTLSYAKIVPPINGVVTDRRIEAGDLAKPGQVLLTVYDPGNMRLEAPVPVRLVEKLKLNQPVTVRLDRPRRDFKGTVSAIVSEIDPLSRTQLVKVHLENAEEDILPGTFGRLWVDDEARDRILAPVDAVYRVGQMELVQIVKADRVLRRAVKTGAKFNGHIEILSGLTDGDVILRQPVKTGA